MSGPRSLRRLAGAAADDSGSRRSARQQNASYLRLPRPSGDAMSSWRSAGGPGPPRRVPRGKQRL